MKVCVCVCVCVCVWLCVLMTISHLIIHGMRNVSDKTCRESQNTHFICFENNAVYKLMWKNIVEPDRPHLTV